MKITRRGLLASGALLGGGFVIGSAGIGVFVQSFDRRKLQQKDLENSPTRVVTQWITVEPDGQVVILSPHTEMGQGAKTGLLQIVLDELDADPKRTRIETAPASPAFTHSDATKGFVFGDDELEGWAGEFVDKAIGRGCQLRHVQFTGGSTAIRFTGWRGIRRAAAAAREMFIVAASERLAVPLAELRTRDSSVWHDLSGTQLSYGQLAAVVATMIPPAEPTYKDSTDWRYVGTRMARIDIPDKVFAKTVYGIDVEVPNLRYAAIAPVTLALGRVQKVRNTDVILTRKGVEAVVVLEDAVAVVADNPWRAEQAARAVEMDCEAPPGGPLDSDAFFALQRATMETAEMSPVRAVGDPAAIGGAGTVVEAEYYAPYLAHTPMEPLNATIWTEGANIHCASGVQDPMYSRKYVADMLEIAVEDLTFHPHSMGGGFGRRTAQSGKNLNWLRHAALIHKEVGGAIKLIWSREADIRLSTFRPSDHAHMKAVLDSDGKPSAWHCQLYGSVMHRKEAAPLYNIPNVTVETANGEPLLPFSYWRSVDASTLTFFIECFIDELAHAANTDPIEYRLSLLPNKSRHARVLKRVAAVSGWSESRAPERALGVALTECFGSIVAQAAEVSLVNGAPKVHRVWCVIDCGLAINPTSVESQMQGGIHYGLSAALYGQITAKDGQIHQSNFNNYKAVRFSDAPRIDVDILSSPDAPVGGAGEPGTPPIAPAVANALAVLNQRPRRLPILS